MARESPGWRGFNAGLLSPQVSARTDLDKYSLGCSVLLNALPEIEGPLVKRPGSRFLAPQADEAIASRLVPFEFSIEETYCLEFGEEVLRVYRHQEIVLDSAHTPVPISGISNLDPVVLFGVTSGIVTGDMVFITGTNVPELNGQFFQVTVGGAGTFWINGVDATGMVEQLVTAGTFQKVYSIASPYTATQAADIHFVQSADVLYLAHGEVPPTKLTRTADDAWSFTTIAFAEQDTTDERLGSWPVFGDLNITPTKLSIASDVVVGGSVLVTATGGAPFLVSDVGRFLKLQVSSSYMGYGLVNAYISPTQVTITVYSRFPNGLPVPPFAGQTVVTLGTAEWAWGAWDATRGYPRTLAFYDARLWWASTASQPQSFWGSVASDFENHRPYGADAGVSDGLAINAISSLSFTLNSNRMNAIEWMAGLESLFLGTRGGEWTVSAANDEQSIAPGNIRVLPRGRIGSRRNVMPLTIDSVILFVQKAGRKLKEWVFDEATQSYVAPDMTRLSREISLGRIKYMAYQQEPNRVVWAIMENGELKSLTYERADQVVAWAEHQLGGEGVVESVAVVPTDTDDEDEVWLAVRRTINGQTRRYIEVLQAYWDRGDVIEDAFYVDAGATYSGVEATRITGLLHLVGETVVVFADGAVVGAKVVDASGTITLDVAATKVTIGLPYDLKMRTMRSGTDVKEGTAQGKLKRPYRVVLRLYQTAPGLFFGQDFDTMDEVFVRDPLDPMDTPVPLFDGDTESLPMPEGYSQEGYLAMRHSEPSPCSIVAAYPQIQTRFKD